MMYSICLDDDDHETDPDWERIEHPHAGVGTPSTASEHAENEAEPQQRQYEDTSGGSDEEFGGSTQVAPKRKKGGYDSRIEQILYENPDLPILIVDAGKSLESGGKFIVYTIRTGVSPQSLSAALFGAVSSSLDRILKFAGVTLNLLPLETPSPDYILH
jgi:hypothetical protein